MFVSVFGILLNERAIKGKHDNSCFIVDDACYFVVQPLLKHEFSALAEQHTLLKEPVFASLTKFGADIVVCLYLVSYYV